MIRLGVYGGTFSPPHLGHIESAEAFYREMKLDKLLIIPTFIPPHKEAKDDASPEDRLEMCKLAFSHIPNTEISDMEIKRGGKSYTYMTLEELSSEDVEIFFLCGTDMILTFDLWKRYEYIFSLASICYVRREQDIEKTQKIKEKTEQYRKLGAKIYEVEHKVVEISSTEIRDSLRGYNPARYLSDGTYDYIKRFGLYGCEPDFDALFETVRARMSEKRFKHTLGVVRAAEKIASFVAPELINKAKICGYLHDITKEDDQQMLVSKYNITLSEDDLISPETVHAITAPYYVKENLKEYALDDILWALSTHTTGSPDMSLLGKILFVADYIEENRIYDSSILLREKLYRELSLLPENKRIEALDKAAIESMENCIGYLKKKGKAVHKLTVATKERLENGIH